MRRDQVAVDGGIDVGMVMTMNVGPDRRITVDVFAAAAVSQQRPLSFNEHDWFVISRTPPRHRGKWMPNIFLVGLNEVLRVPFIHCVIGPAAFARRSPSPRRTPCAVDIFGK